MASTDRDVLLVLYRSTGGDTWKQKEKWNTGADLSEWHGVVVNDQGRVVELDLAYNNLQGRIPSELGKLVALTTLNFLHNQLSGPIPEELSALTEMRQLTLSVNQLTGPIPKELGALTKVQQLSLHSNQLTGAIPRELGKLTALLELDLSYNGLTGAIPIEFGKLTALLELDLSQNDLTVLWDTLGKEDPGSVATPPGTLPVALATVLDMFDGVEAGLNLAQNPWEHPPEAFVADGMPAVRDYFEAMYKGGAITVTRPLKVVIVGKETVGKTSLRRSITSGKPSKTQEGGVESTVHVDVEDHVIGGHPIRIFDSAGQVVYYGLLQLFLTPGAAYLLVWDAGEASKMVWDAENISNLESLAIAPWLRHLTFRVPDAHVVLVGNKWDLVGSKQDVASQVESQSRGWLTSWIDRARGSQSRKLSLEDGVSLVSCAPSVRAVLAPAFGVGTGWPCDKSKPGLLYRITHNAAGHTRALTMRLPPSYRLALGVLEKLASCGRRDFSPGITRAGLEKKWQAEVGALKAAGTPVAAPEAAMSGAILIRKWEGGLVEYGNYIFLDVQWFATVLDPLFSHKRDSFGNLDLGGRRVTNARSLDRLEKENIFEPQLAEELWGAELKPHLLLALNSAGLTFPLPKDPEGGLVILLRMDTKPPDDYSIKLNSQLGQADQAKKHDLRLHVECPFILGLPPGFVERLLARCCRLGFPYPFWRFGVLIVGEGVEEGLFSLSLEYSEENNTLTVEVYGGCKEVHAWGALSKVLSVMIKMRAEFPGLPCEPTFFCPLHKDKGMPIRMTDARPGSPLIEGRFCLLCNEQKAGRDLLATALQVVKFSDEEFFDAQLCQQFAEKAGNVALWPGSNFEASRPALPPNSPDNSTSHVFNGVATLQDSRTPWYQDLRTWVGAASVACLAVFGVFAGQEDDKPRLWGVFLGAGMLLLGLEFVLIAREHKVLCFARRLDVASVGNEERGEARV